MTIKHWINMHGGKMIPGKTLTILLISISIAGCSPVGEVHKENIPDLSPPNSTSHVNPEWIISLAQTEVNNLLPDASLIFFSYIGKCSELLNLSEQYTFMFTKSNWRLLGKRTYSALVIINVAKETLDIEVEDVSEHYLTIIPMELTGEEIVDIARIAQTALRSEQKCHGTIVLAKGKTEGPWGIRCGEPDEVYIECMEIDLRSESIIIK